MALSSRSGVVRGFSGAACVSRSGSRSVVRSGSRVGVRSAGRVVDSAVGAVSEVAVVRESSVCGRCSVVSGRGVVSRLVFSTSLVSFSDSLVEGPTARCDV